MDRRNFLWCAAALTSCGVFSTKVYSQSDSFQNILVEMNSNLDAVTGATAFRDFALEGDGVQCINVKIDGEETCIVSAARRPPRLAPSSLTISQDAKNLIVFCEVTSKSTYESKLMLPIWPGGSSGVTIGIGYDLGYVSADDFRKEWASFLHPFTVEALISVCGLKGEAGQNAIPSINQIRVEWEQAIAQFEQVLLPIFVSQTEKFTPNIAKLPADCRGALVSLVFNRGTALTLKNDTNDSRREMREIVQLMEDENFDEIPGKIVDMNRLWKDKPKAKGVVLRRKAEAALFRKGLQT